MKKILLAVMAVATISMAYSPQVSAQPQQVQKVTASGSYNNGGTTAWKDWKVSDMPLVTTARTITLSTADTFNNRMRGEVNRQTYVFVVDSIAGRIDSATIVLQAAVDSGATANITDWVTLQTFTCANQAKNTFKYEMTGNNYAATRSLLKVGNKAAGSSARFKAKLLVRYKEAEWWEALDSAWPADRTSYLNGSMP